MSAGRREDVGPTSPISPPVISTFLVGFGFCGCCREGVPPPVVPVGLTAIAVSVGLASAIFLVLARLMESAQGTHVAYADLVGCEAECHHTHPGQQRG
jgi:hypothetical protein